MSPLVRNWSLWACDWKRAVSTRWRKRSRSKWSFRFGWQDGAVAKLNERKGPGKGRCSTQFQSLFCEFTCLVFCCCCCCCCCWWWWWWWWCWCWCWCWCCMLLCFLVFSCVFCIFLYLLVSSHYIVFSCKSQCSSLISRFCWWKFLNCQGMMRALNQEQKDEVEKNEACNKAGSPRSVGYGNLNVHSRTNTVRTWPSRLVDSTIKK